MDLGDNLKKEVAEEKRKQGFELYRDAFLAGDTELMDKALGCFDQATKIDPSNGKAQEFYGMGLFGTHRLTLGEDLLRRGISHCERAEELLGEGSRSFWFYGALAEAYHLVGRREDARKALAQARRLNPNFPVPDRLQKYL